MLLLFRLNLQIPGIAPPVEVHDDSRTFGSFVTKAHPSEAARARSVRIIAYDAKQLDDQDVEDILIMVTHLWL